MVHLDYPFLHYLEVLLLLDLSIMKGLNYLGLGLGKCFLGRVDFGLAGIDLVADLK